MHRCHCALHRASTTALPLCTAHGPALHKHDDGALHDTSSVKMSLHITHGQHHSTAPRTAQGPALHRVVLLHCMGSAGPRCHCALHTASTAALPPRTAQSSATHTDAMMLHCTIRSRARTPAGLGGPRGRCRRTAHTSPRAAQCPEALRVSPFPARSPAPPLPAPHRAPRGPPPGSAPAQFRARPSPPPPPNGRCVYVCGVGGGGRARRPLPALKAPQSRGAAPATPPTPRPTPSRGSGGAAEWGRAARGWLWGGRGAMWSRSRRAALT